MGNKVVKKMLVIVCIIAMILPFSSEVLAQIVETAEGTKQKFGIELLHESKTMDGKKSLSFGYRIDTKNAYRLYSGNKDFETTILCLDKTLRFPQEADSEGVIANEGDYVSLGEATEENLIEAKKEITSADANKIQWLIQNALLPEDSEELREQKLAKIFNTLMVNTSTTQNPLTLDDIKEILTEDDVVFALQATLWSITNDEKIGTLLGTTDGENWDGLNGNDKWGYQGKKGAYINEIMNYYKTQLEANLEEDKTPKTNPEFNNTTIQDPISIEGAYAFVGPFNIKEATNYYTIDMAFEDEAGNELEDINYVLVDRPSNLATVLPQTKESLEGKDFYIRLRANTSARKVKFNLKTQVQTTSSTGTVWVIEDKDIKAQPLLTIQREEEPGIEIPYEKDFDIIITTKYDVSLRKYISMVKRKTVTGNWQIIYNPENGIGTDTRVPEGPKVATGTDPFNQYEYLHKKQPLEVQVGDRIEYTIVVTNECDEEVIVQNITDYLPPSGIEYASGDSINTDENWIYSSTERKVITDKTKEKVLTPGTQTKVRIVCDVTEKAEGKVITNIAEITGISDGEGKAITDIDSKPSNIVLPKTEKEWQEYKGNESKQYGNKEDLNDSKYYYKGQEDDDDFEKIVVPGTLDLALRKSIETVNGEAKNRKKDPDTTPLKDGSDTTSIFTDIKTPVSVKAGDVVVYTIRVFNEGKTEASVGRIEDYIPEGLGFMPYYNLNIQNGWVLSEGTKTLKLSSIANATSNLSQSDFASTVTDYKNTDVVEGKATIGTEKLANEIIAPYDIENDKLASKQVQIACIVLGTVEPETIIKNIAAITKYKDSDGNVVEKDIDSDTTTPIDPSTYPQDDHIQDDDDFEKLILKETSYDLALKKFITQVTSPDGSNREIPADQLRKLVVKDVAPLVNRKDKEKVDAVYELNKKPVNVTKGEYVTYTIRVFNEGSQDAIVKEIVDSVPEGLEFVTYEKNSDGTYKSGSKINYNYGWEKFDNKQTGWKTGIRTTHLLNTVIPAFDKLQTTDPAKNIEKGLSYVDVQVEFKVVTSKHEEITNIAEITDDDGDDNDSTPNNKIPEEDDQDYDVVIPLEFDLSLRKFITQINNEKITQREPKVTYKDGKLTYTHPKDPMIVVKGQEVIYTIRVYNEGTQEGYAAEIKDDLPEGITFLPDHETNKKYGWKMYDKNGKETDDVTKAVNIRTPYLSKAESEKRGEDNLLKPFNSKEEVSKTNPDYRDVKVAFEVTQDSVTDGNKVIINTAEISKDEDKNGDEVDDIDSIPDNDKDGEDDIDKEYIELKYFDLSLLKYVSKVIVTEDGVTKETETKYDGTENPEPVVKVELNKKKLDKTQVKYVYSIKITNEGEIEGYAKEVTDRIPDGLAFYEEDNTEYRWKIKEDGIVTTDYLKDTLLKPGESAVIQIVLRWVNSETNLGQKVNVAEISKDENEYNVPDIDSTPNNNVEGEDDQDSAIVVLSIKTGSTPIYITLIITIMAIFASGSYLIYKYVIKK